MHLILRPTPTAQWHALVNEAEDACGQRVSEDLESYLVFLLQRFTRKPEVAASVLGLDYLQSQHLTGVQRVDELREVGDKCLLFSGLFPERALRRRVPVSYFVQLGRTAYQSLADLYDNKEALSNLYVALHGHFVRLMDLLHCMREFSDAGEPLTVLQAQELWHNTGSEHALKILQRHAKKGWFCGDVDSKGIIH